MQRTKVEDREIKLLRSRVDLHVLMPTCESKAATSAVAVLVKRRTPGYEDRSS
jgi:hypothetical protein